MRMVRWWAGGPVLALLLLVAPASAAGGINLSWDRCRGDGGAPLRTFACDTNLGGEVLVASFVLDAPMPQVSGNEITIDLISEADPLPPWWDMKNIGTCRPGSLGMNLVEDVNDVVCRAWAAGQSTGGIGAYNTELGPIDVTLVNRHRRLRIAVAVPETGLADLVADTEYFSCNITIDHAKTVGPDACSGCSGSVCLAYTSLRITTPVAQNDLSLTAPAQPGSNMAQWQGTGADCSLVPVKRATWAQVKGLYR